MRKIIICFWLLALISGWTADAAVPPNRTEWFTDARFGLFIHFGLYSLPAGVWDGQVMGRNMYAEWIRMQHNWPQDPGLAQKEYDTLLKRFNPVRFDAVEWVRAAKQAGMKYMLITAKHHDGFALWPSQVCSYNVVDATPFGRDILGELAKACEQEGLVLGFYYSHWQDWEHPGGVRPPWPEYAHLPRFQQPEESEFESYWRDKCLPQVRELIVNYDPGFFWFDTWTDALYINEERLDELINLVRSLSPDCLINSRIGTTWGHRKGDEIVDFLSMGDNSFPNRTIHRPWETSGTMNHSWGYHQLDFSWKPYEQMLKYLITNASRGGNYQLNVGPKGDGSFPLPAVKRLQQIGAWLAVNGEAIYGTSSSTLPEQEWGQVTVSERKNGLTRFYLHVFDWPKDGMLPLKGLRQLPETAYVLESGQQVSGLPDHDAIVFQLPQQPADEGIYVIVADMKYSVDKK